MSWQHRTFTSAPRSDGKPGFVPRAMRQYRKARTVTETKPKPKHVRDMADAEYQAAKAEQIAQGHAQRRAAEVTREGREIAARFNPKCEFSGNFELIYDGQPLTFRTGQTYSIDAALLAALHAAGAPIISE